MKANINVAWFESEIDRIVQTIKQHNETNLSCQFTQRDLQSRITYRKLLDYSKDSSSWLFRFGLILSILFSLVLINWNMFTLVRPKNDSNCLVKLPDWLQNAFVAPNHCDFCHNLTSIDRLQHLSKEDFTSK